MTFVARPLRRAARATRSRARATAPASRCSPIRCPRPCATARRPISSCPTPPASTVSLSAAARPPGAAQLLGDLVPALRRRGAVAGGSRAPPATAPTCACSPSASTTTGTPIRQLLRQGERHRRAARHLARRPQEVRHREVSRDVPDRRRRAAFATTSSTSATGRGPKRSPASRACAERSRRNRRQYRGATAPIELRNTVAAENAGRSSPTRAFFGAAPARR